MRREVIINGDNFDDLEGFYTEIEKILTSNLTWRTGHNLDAFNDLLRGGFGVHEYGEPLAIRWLKSDKSRCDFGYKATEEYYKNMLERCHRTNRALVVEKMKQAGQGQGETLMDIIVEIILDTEGSGHDCTLVLEP